MRCPRDSLLAPTVSGYDRAVNRRKSVNHLRILRAALALGFVGCASGSASSSLPDPAIADSALVRPDFSGAWVLDAAASQALTMGGGGGSGAGTGQGGGLGLGPPAERITIRQNATQLTVEENFGSVRSRLTYRFDGRAAQNSVPVGGGRASGSGRFQSSWDDERLVTEITIQVARVPARRYREVRSLTADGALVVEISEVGRPTRGRRSVYRLAG